MIDQTPTPPASSAPLPELTGEVPLAQNRHKVWVAVLLCFVLMGAGQMYNRQILKGIAVLVLGYILSYLTETHSSFWIILVLFIIAVIVDARLIAKKIRRGEPVRAWDFS